MAQARRRFGQHFLSDPRLLDRIAATLAPEPGDAVLEIGPGRGSLTAALLRRGARVTVIEVDRDLAADLRARFSEVRIVEGDALALDWAAVMEEAAGGYLLTGNIPYNITSPLLDKALTPPRPRRIVFLVQREVADRVTAAPGTAEYGALTVGIQAVAEAQRVFSVPAGAFHPRPKVGSAVIRIVPRTHPLVSEQEARAFRQFVTGLFGLRRKQLLRALRELTAWPADQAGRVLEEAGLSASARAETLSPAGLVALYRHVIDGGWRGG